MALLVPEGLVEFLKAGQVGADNVPRLAWFPDGRLYKVTSVILFARAKVRIEAITLADARRIHDRGRYRKPQRSNMTVGTDEVIPTVVAPAQYNEPSGE